MTTMIVEENQLQRHSEWHEVRLGRFTASEFYRLMTEPRAKADKEAGNLSQGAMTYVMEKVAERITGKPAKDEFDSRYTQWGEEYEPLARSIYEAVFDRKVTLSGFMEFGSHGGGSPDGLIGEEGIIEIKCPYTITSHLTHHMMKSWEDLKSDKPEYYWQCLGYILLTGRQWCDFISYHPHFPAKLQLKRLTISRDDVQADMLHLHLKLEKAAQVFDDFFHSII